MDSGAHVGFVRGLRMTELYTYSVGVGYLLPIRRIGPNIDEL